MILSHMALSCFHIMSPYGTIRTHFNQHYVDFHCRVLFFSRVPQHSKCYCTCMNNWPNTIKCLGSDDNVIMSLGIESSATEGRGPILSGIGKSRCSGFAILLKIPQIVDSLMGFSGSHGRGLVPWISCTLRCGSAVQTPSRP